MKLPVTVPLLLIGALLAGCGSHSVAPRYTTEDPELMRISEDRPADPEIYTEDLGSYCVEITETWNSHGSTPDGQTLWAKDTYRVVVPCD